MTLKFKKILVFVLAGVVYLAGQYFRGAWFPHFTWPLSCREIIFGTTSYCDPKYLDILGFPLIALGQMLAIIAVVLLLANAETFRKWLKVSAFYIPTAILLVYWIYPLRFPPGPVVPASQGVYPFGWLYVLISVGIVLISWFRQRK
jgi:hypothetical protein